MNNTNKHLLLMAIIAILALSGCDKDEGFPSNSAKAPTKAAYASITSPTGPAQFCPQAKDLIKRNNVWISKDDKWKNFTHSSASKILSFLGAQWIGVKVGKIICLYKTNEAVSFPLALEKIHSQPIPEPNAGGWSALVNNRRFCKSANVADCAYFAAYEKNISDIYKEIEYNPGAIQN